MIEYKSNIKKNKLSNILYRFVLKNYENTYVNIYMWIIHISKIAKKNYT